VKRTLQKLDSIRLHEIDAAVLLRDAARPDVGAEVFQGFGMADAPEGIIPERRLNEIEQAFGRAVFPREVARYAARRCPSPPSRSPSRASETFRAAP
jgi:hypothetical protein